MSATDEHGRAPGAPVSTGTFARCSDLQLVEYWNEGDGALSWLLELEVELCHRGYEPREKFYGETRERIGNGSRMRLEVKS